MKRARARSSPAVVAACLALSMATLTYAVPAVAATPAAVRGPASGAAKPAQKGAPLDPLSAAEIRAVFRVIRADSRFPKSGFVPAMTLLEPPKADVLVWQPGQPFSRKATLNVYDRDANVVNEVVVDLRSNSVESWTPRPGVEPAVYGTEWTAADSIVRKDARWQAAIAARGLKPKDIYIDIWAPGDTAGIDDSNGDRLLRAITFYRGNLPNPYDRPVEGITVTIDMTTRTVLDVTDSGIVPVDKTETGDARRPRHGLKPLIVSQPQGPSFDIKGREVSWQGWHFRVDYSPREGMVLHQVGFQQGGVVRPIIYRLALSEIYVPYALPDPSWAWRTAFDVGEYELGQYAEALQRGVDVPSNAVFFNENAAADSVADGAVVPLPHAEAMFERDGGSLWDRLDPSTYERDARLARELVVTAAYPIGNYTYDIEYSFRLDGSIGVRVGATGTTLNQGITTIAAGDQYGAAVTPSVAAPAHQHFLSFRIDFDVDGTANDVMSEETTSAPSAAGNAFVLTQTPISSEGFGDADAEAGRTWRVQSSTKVGALGSPTAYSLVPDSWTVPYSAPTFAGLQRAAFAAHPFWVTTYAPEQLYAAGDYPIAGDVGDGLARYVAPAQSVGGNDVVVWYTTGFTHHPEPEEYPVMTADSLGFEITPSGFFDRNPALDVPAAR